MSILDPDMIDFASLFPEESIFDSRESWQRAGFDVVDRDDAEEIMVAGHAAAPDFLFKKFTNRISSRQQLRNYQGRIDGAAALHQLVAAEKLRRVAVPRKWLRAVPGGHLLVVDRIDVLSRSETKDAYGRIDEETLRDLCVVVHAFRGLDSGARNMLITRDGKVAFVDTERWDHDRDRPPLKRVREYLTPERRKLAEKIFKKLDD